MAIWTQKPPLGSQLNFSHPLSQGLVGCWLMNEGGGVSRNIISLKSSSLSSGATWCPDGINFDGTVNGKINTGYNLMSGIMGGVANKVPTSMTLGVIMSVNSTSIHGSALKWGGITPFGDANTNGVSLGLGDTNFDNNGNNMIVLYENVQWFPTTIPFPINKFNSFFITAKSGVGLNLYLNGINVYYTATSAYNQDQSGGNSTSEVFIGGYWSSNSSTNRDLPCKMKIAYIWNRILSPVEITSLYQAPYQFIQPIRRVFYSIGAAPEPPATSLAYGYMTTNSKFW